MGLTHSFGPKLAIFPTFFWGGGNIGQENVFLRYSRTENAFLGQKNKKFKKSKNWHLSIGFGPKMALFPTFFWGKICQ